MGSRSDGLDMQARAGNFSDPPNHVLNPCLGTKLQAPQTIVLKPLCYDMFASHSTAELGKILLISEKTFHKTSIIVHLGTLDSLLSGVNFPFRPSSGLKNNRLPDD